MREKSEYLLSQLKEIHDLIQGVKCALAIKDFTSLNALMLQVTSKTAGTKLIFEIYFEHLEPAWQKKITDIIDEIYEDITKLKLDIDQHIIGLVK